MKNFKQIGLLSLGCILTSCYSFDASSTSTDRLLNLPAKSKITFIKDFIIPAHESVIPLGIDSSGGYQTECKMFMSTFDPLIRKVPAGSVFLVRDTKEGYLQKVEVLIASRDINSIKCSTYKPQSDDYIASTSSIVYTNIYQAQMALKDKIKITINTEPKLILGEKIEKIEKIKEARNEETPEELPPPP